MILTRDAILRELNTGRLRIEPFELDQVGAASIDLHLGSQLRLLPRNCDAPIPVTEDAEIERRTEVIELNGSYVLEPGETVLGVTRERLFLPSDLCGWLEGRSRIARLGLTVHVTSGFVQPGSCNHQVLEMSNVGSARLSLRPDVRICQIVLQRTEGEAVYSGRFASQSSP